MTGVGMVALRMAATLVHSLPGVLARLHHDGRTVLTVARPCDASGPAVGPCAFRATVARAHREVQAGGTVVFGDLAVGVEPAVEVTVRSGVVLPGGVYRVELGDAVVHGFATPLPPARCRALLAGVADVQLHRDAATEVTFVHAAHTEAGGSPFDDVLAAFLVDEVAGVVARR